MLKNANWARYNLAVSLRKETEPSSSSMWNLNLPGDPMVDFHKFFDGENITQQDLVAWINVGMHHVVCVFFFPSFFYCILVFMDDFFFSLLLKIHLTPRPQLLLPGIYYYTYFFSISYSLNFDLFSFMLTPVNYFDYDVTMESKNAILIHPLQDQSGGGSGGVFEFDDYGVKQNFHCLPDAPPDFEYTDSSSMGVDGFVDVERFAEIRKAQEMFFRLKAVPKREL